MNTILTSNIVVLCVWMNSLHASSCILIQGTFSNLFLLDSWGYFPKVGYLWLNTIHLDRERHWWWKCLWRYNCLAKSKLLGWTILEGKTRTWDVLQKHLYQRPGWCVLCCECVETINHLFVHCPFTNKIWMETLNFMGLRWRWTGCWKAR